MTTQTAQLFFALLTIATLIGVIALVICRIVASRSAAAAGVARSATFHRMPLISAITVTSMLGSLYFSEIADYVPCTLCWYQRIAMYSVAIISTIAAVRREDIRVYTGALAGIGLVISTYHWFLERFPELETGACSSSVPCDLVWFERFGFVTLPFMAFTGFLAVLTLSVLSGSVTSGKD